MCSIRVLLRTSTGNGRLQGKLTQETSGTRKKGGWPDGQMRSTMTVRPCYPRVCCGWRRPTVLSTGDWSGGAQCESIDSAGGRKKSARAREHTLELGHGWAPAAIFPILATLARPEDWFSIAGSRGYDGSSAVVRTREQDTGLAR